MRIINIPGGDTWCLLRNPCYKHRRGGYNQSDGMIHYKGEACYSILCGRKALGWTTAAGERGYQDFNLLSVLSPRPSGIVGEVEGRRSDREAVIGGLYQKLFAQRRPALRAIAVHWSVLREGFHPCG